jgi:aldehyde:ferredoxin oxidoreductase
VNEKRAQLSANGNQVLGYAGQLLRVNLAKGESTTEKLDENLLSKYFGGLRLPKDTLQDLVSKFSDDPKTAQMFGSAPSLDDMLIKHPAVALSPIAMYR